MTVPAKSTPPGSDAFWAWFDADICNRTTATFLRTAEAEFLLQQYRNRVQDEIAAIRNAIAKGMRPDCGRRLRIALSNWSLKERSGSELWTFDIANYLHRANHDVIVHAPVLGAVADAIAASEVLRVGDSFTARDASRPAPILDAMREAKMRALEGKSLADIHAMLARRETPVLG